MIFEWKEGEIKQRLSALIDHVIETALQDETITTDEEELIELIRKEVWKLEAPINDLVRNEVVLDDARTEIRKMFEEILNYAAQSAKEDGTITADELLIIDRLAKYVRNKDFAEYID